MRENVIVSFVLHESDETASSALTPTLSRRAREPQLSLLRVQCNFKLTIMQRASTSNARRLRRASTPCEVTLWKLLRDRQLEGFKFRRQHPIGRYFADFACASAMIVVELDGRIHDDQLEYDAMRDQYIELVGWKVLRFSNHDLIHNREGVWLQIAAQLISKTEEKIMAHSNEQDVVIAFRQSVEEELHRLQVEGDTSEPTYDADRSTEENLAHLAHSHAQLQSEVALLRTIILKLISNPVDEHDS